MEKEGGLGSSSNTLTGSDLFKLVDRDQSRVTKPQKAAVYGGDYCTTIKPQQHESDADDAKEVCSKSFTSGGIFYVWFCCSQYNVVLLTLCGAFACSPRPGELICATCLCCDLPPRRVPPLFFFLFFFPPFFKIFLSIQSLQKLLQVGTSSPSGKYNINVLGGDRPLMPELKLQPFDGVPVSCVLLFFRA